MSASKILTQLRFGQRPPAGAQAPPPPPAAPPPRLALLADSDPEDEAPPESESWEEDDDVLDPRFDWRRNTRRGRKSRKNYSAFLADRIRSDERAARLARDPGDNGGPDLG